VQVTVAKSSTSGTTYTTATNSVSIGTLTPRAATSYKVNITPTTSTTSTPLPAGSLVGFYQTLPASGEVPYVIEQSPVDPSTAHL